MTREEIEDRILELEDNILWGYKLLQQNGITEEELNVQVKDIEKEIKKLNKLKRKYK